MANIILLREQGVASTDAKTLFDHRRAELVRAFRLWLSTEPAPLDVMMEIEGTTNQLFALAILAEVDG